MNPTRSDFRRRAAALFDQQMWCFGRDIVRPDGNVLLDLGMCRYRPRDPSRKSSLYTAAIEPAGSLYLWGFGAMYAESGLGGVFVRRYGFAPRLSARESAVGVFDPEQLGPLTSPVSPHDDRRLRTLLPRLVGWFARYEHWVAENFGTKYRDDCLCQRGKPVAVPAREMAVAWETTAKKCKRFRSEPERIHGPWGKLFLALHSGSNSRPTVLGRRRLNFTQHDRVRVRDSE